MIENIEEKPQGGGQAMSNGLSVEVNNNLNSLPESISNSPSAEQIKRQVILSNRKAFLQVYWVCMPV